MFNISPTSILNVVMIYEVTVFIDNDLEEKWRNYMKKHIMDVMATGCFSKVAWFEIDDSASTRRGFVICYTYETEEDFKTYSQHYAKDLQKEHTDLFQDHFSASRRLLKQLEI